MSDDEAIDIALDALRHAERVFRSYDHYPSEQYRRERIDEVQQARQVLQSIRGR